MSQQTAATPETTLADMFGGIRAVALALVIGLLVLGGLFHAEAEAAVKTWIDSTAYNHCFLVVPIVAWLIWDRKESLRGLTAKPIPAVAILIAPLGIAWLAAERLGIMEGRQLAVVSMAEVLLLAILGWRLWRAVAGPLLYLYFLVPFGEFLTPKLQDITAWFTRHGLEILGIPAYIDGYVIEIKEGTFFVAEACAGLRFLIASVAFGALYALMMYRSPVRRTVFIAVSIVVPIVANGFRALGIVVLGQILGSAEAAAADHVLYGWIFFSIVILILIAIGLPFREDDQPEKPNLTPMPADPAAARQGMMAALAVTVFAMIGPASVFGLSLAASIPDRLAAEIDLGCQPIGAPLIRTGTPGRSVVQRMMCDGLPLTVHVEVFSRRTTAGPVNAERRRLTRLMEAEDLTDTPLFQDEPGKPRGWRVTFARQPGFVVVSGLWIGGEPANLGLRMRLEMAQTSLTGADLAPVLIVITPAVDWTKVTPQQRSEMLTALPKLIEAHPDIGDRLVRTLAAQR